MLVKLEVSLAIPNDLFDLIKMTIILQPTTRPKSLLSYKVAVTMNIFIPRRNIFERFNQTLITDSDTTLVSFNMECNDSLQPDSNFPGAGIMVKEEHVPLQ